MYNLNSRNWNRSRAVYVEKTKNKLILHSSLYEFLKQMAMIILHVRESLKQSVDVSNKPLESPSQNYSTRAGERASNSTTILTLARIVEKDH